MNRHRAGARRRTSEFFETYTKDLKAEDLQRLFTRDAKEAYRFFTRHVDFSEVRALPWHRRIARSVRLVFLAFTMKLSPARRIVYGASVVAAVLGLINLFLGFISFSLNGPFGIRLLFFIPLPTFRNGTGSLLVAFLLMNLLVLLEVADRLSLKNDLEIARDIQQAMLPSGLYRAPGVETVGLSRPANTVGGDFYDILPLPDGRLVVAVGDVAGKGSPAALLMALLLAMMRTLVDEGLEPGALVARLNIQVSRHAPASRFITLFYGVYEPATGEMTFVNAGHTSPLLLRAGRRVRAADGGRHRARHVRGLVLRDGHGVPAPGRAAGRLQRRHHRGGEPGGPPLRRTGARSRAARQPAGRRPGPGRHHRAGGRGVHRGYAPRRRPDHPVAPAVDPMPPAGV